MEHNAHVACPVDLCLLHSHLRASTGRRSAISAFSDDLWQSAAPRLVPVLHLCAAWLSLLTDQAAYVGLYTMLAPAADTPDRCHAGGLEVLSCMTRQEAAPSGPDCRAALEHVACVPQNLCLRSGHALCCRPRSRILTLPQSQQSQLDNLPCLATRDQLLLVLATKSTLSASWPWSTAHAHLKLGATDLGTRFAAVLAPFQNFDVAVLIQLLVKPLHAQSECCGSGGSVCACHSCRSKGDAAS